MRAIYSSPSWGMKRVGVEHMTGSSVSHVTQVWPRCSRTIGCLSMSCKQLDAPSSTTDLWVLHGEGPRLTPSISSWRLVMGKTTALGVWRSTSNQSRHIGPGGAMAWFNRSAYWCGTWSVIENSQYVAPCSVWEAILLGEIIKSCLTWPGPHLARYCWAHLAFVCIKHPATFPFLSKTGVSWRFTRMGVLGVDRQSLLICCFQWSSQNKYVRNGLQGCDLKAGHSRQLRVSISCWLPSSLLIQHTNLDCVLFLPAVVLSAPFNMCWEEMWSKNNCM